MKAFFVAVETSLARAQLAGKRRRLARLLRARSVELQTVRAAGDEASIARLASESRGAPVIALDDQHALPEKAPWLADLVKHASDFAAHRRPRIVYVTRHTSAAGMTQALRHPLVRHYIQRDEGNRWVEAAAEATLGLVDQIQAEARAADQPTPGVAAPEIIGASPCFREAVQGVNRLLRGPYGLVTGPSGVGKLFLIRTLWQQMKGRPRVIIVACGSFFKDYYVAGGHRRYGGGREAVDQLVPFLSEADDGLLILHHVEQLPTAVQQELEARMAVASGGPKKAVRFLNFDKEGIVEYDVRVVATSTCEPELLMRTGRLIPDLVRLLQKHHVRIPTLAERGTEDLRLLCEGFLKWIAQQEGQTGAPRIERKALAVLARTPWPNNLTDLLRVLEKAFHAAKGATIRRQHLPKGLVTAPCTGEAMTLDEITAQAQRAAIQNALEQTGGNVTQAAALLGRNKHALYRLMHRLGIPGARSRHKR
jgi:DNA-binding NtrC family response regulator